VNVRALASRIAAVIISASLFGCGRPGDNSVSVEPRNIAGSGSSIYRLRCASCHQPNGCGLPGTCPPLAGSPRVNGPKTPLITLMLQGMKGPQVIGDRTFNGVMPSWKDSLSSDEIANVLTFLRRSWSNRGSKITAEEIDAVRSSLADRALFPSPAEVDGSAKPPQLRE
jgi:mono/diheme cytochrome c family protein